MKLLDLEVECIKNVQKDNNLDFNTDSKEMFDTFKDNPMYSSYINNVMTSINSAISRIVSSEKLPNRTEIITLDADLSSYKSCKKNFLLDLTNNQDIDWASVYKIKHIYISTSEEDLRELHFIPTKGNKQLLITSFTYTGENPILHIEYSINIPRLKHDLDYDKDLYQEYGITDNMCYSYILKYVKSELWEDEEPKLAQQYMNFAEQFLNNFEKEEQSIVQTSVKREYYY